MNRSKDNNYDYTIFFYEYTTHLKPNYIVIYTYEITELSGKKRKILIFSFILISIRNNKTILFACIIQKTTKHDCDTISRVHNTRFTPGYIVIYIYVITELSNKRC